MVCLGNICRSPLAEGILKNMIEETSKDWFVDSAGTGSWHVGEPPHRGSQKVAISEEEKKKVKLILNYSFPGTNMAVPDPYFTGGFDEVYSLLNKACQQLLNNLKV